jgi:hypothetical protein
MLVRTTALARRQRTARNTRRWRGRKARGQFMAKFPADRVATEEALIAARLLAESDRDDQAKVAAAMAKVWAMVIGHEDEISDGLKIPSPLI